jgi:hypothetical protein
MTETAWPSIFGPLVAGGDVEQWVLDLLQTWFSTYLAEVERQHGYGGNDLPRPRGWAVGPTFDKWPEDQLPGVLVASRGVPTPPVKRGSGGYEARWQIEPGVILSARTQTETHALAMLYGLAIRALMIQRPSLDGYAEASTWLGEAYDDLGYDDSRSLYAVRELFAVAVVDVTFTGAGPVTPDVPLSPDDTVPWPDWQPVETVDVDVVNVAADQSLPEEEE